MSKHPEPSDNTTPLLKPSYRDFASTLVSPGVTSSSISTSSALPGAKRGRDDNQALVLRAPSPSLRAPSPIGEGEGKRCKQCNCKNSKCLKLYCECFAARVFCDGCNCVGCCNNKDNEEMVQKAVAATLERNPKAFSPKINTSPLPPGVTPGKHSKGCHCKKSNCLKKYCECFQANVLCGDHCKCVECKNYEGSVDRRAILQTNGRTTPSPPPLKKQRGLSSPQDPFIFKSDESQNLVMKNSFFKPIQDTMFANALLNRPHSSFEPRATITAPQFKEPSSSFTQALLLAAKEEEKNNSGALANALNATPFIAPISLANSDLAAALNQFQQPLPQNLNLNLMKSRPSSCPPLSHSLMPDVDYNALMLKYGSQLGLPPVPQARLLPNSPIVIPPPPLFNPQPEQERAVLEELSSFMKKTVALTPDNINQRSLLQLAPLRVPSPLPPRSISPVVETLGRLSPAPSQFQPIGSSLPRSASPITTSSDAPRSESPSFLSSSASAFGKPSAFRQLKIDSDAPTSPPSSSTTTTTTTANTTTTTPSKIPETSPSEDTKSKESKVKSDKIKEESKRTKDSKDVKSTDK